jgi:hypothetical protein
MAMEHGASVESLGMQLLQWFQHLGSGTVDVNVAQMLKLWMKKLDSICCPQCRETKADTFKQLRPIGEGDQELEKRLDQEELT